MNKIAIIDMGTNTFHLLIAQARDQSYDVVHREHVAVRIGKAGINEGFISENAFDRAIATMKLFKHKIEQYQVSTTYAFGTSALRNANNGLTLAEKIRSLTGIEIHVITGDQEADLIYAGVKSAMDLGTDKNLVIDIGAGSVEFIIGNQEQIFWKQSFEIGGQRLLEKFHKQDPITEAEITSLDVFFDSILAPLWKAVKKFEPVTLIGSSGSFDTLSDIYCIRKRIPRTLNEKETPLTHDGFYQIYRELIRKNRDERMLIEGMIEMRVEMIVVACCLIRFVLEKHPFRGIRVSTYSLKEGVLANLAEGKPGF
jgi:exopolyphosphatase/guanosine-5'-triphosphate,3'-diphosphate pyrophosphatase